MSELFPQKAEYSHRPQHRWRGNGSGGETKGKDVRDIFEGHATEGGYSRRCWGLLLSAVLIGDSIEMYGF